MGIYREGVPKTACGRQPTNFGDGEDGPMKPHMAKQEMALFESLLQRTSAYLEFGAGGSTCLAATIVKGSIISVDSAAAWLDKVRDACRANPASLIEPKLVLADIGPTGNWGYPLNESSRDKWPVYHSRIWDFPESSQGDLYLVDGRFRVACFMQILLHCRPEAVIAVHDFAGRPYYQPIREMAEEIAVAETLAVLRPKPNLDKRRVRDVLAMHAYDPR